MTVIKQVFITPLQTKWMGIYNFFSVSFNPIVGLFKLCLTQNLNSMKVVHLSCPTAEKERKEILQGHMLNILYAISSCLSPEFG